MKREMTARRWNKQSLQQRTTGSAKIQHSPTWSFVVIRVVAVALSVSCVAPVVVEAGSRRWSALIRSAMANENIPSRLDGTMRLFQRQHQRHRWTMQTTSRHSHPHSLQQQEEEDEVAVKDIRHQRRLSLLSSLRGGATAVVRDGSESRIAPPIEDDTTKEVAAASTILSLTTSAEQLAYNASLIDAGATRLDDLVALLQTSLVLGVTSAQATVRHAQYGPNALAQPKRKSLLLLVLEQFQDRLVQILLGVAVLSGLFSWAEVRSAAALDEATAETTATATAVWKHFVEPLVIVAILALNAMVGVWQTQSASNSLTALQNMQAATCTVVRQNVDGSTRSVATIPASLLVPGDIVMLSPGDKVPADGRVVSLSSSVLTVDEGSLTGESVTVSKYPGDEGTMDTTGLSIADQRGMVYAGTMVTRGSATVLVTATGTTTQFGRIQLGVLQAEPPKTPLQVKLDDFGRELTVVIAVICACVWIVSIPKMNDPSFGSVWNGMVYYSKVAVALGVAAIPEGLPAVITLCLSLGTRRMAQRNVIVRRLPSVETLGCTSVICTDKTGTLTTNEMTVVSLVMVEHSKKDGAVVCEHSVEGVSYSPLGAIDGIPSHEEVVERPLGAVADVAAVSALCNDARIIGNDGVNSEEKKLYERVGEPTEAALCVLAEKIGGMRRLSDDTVAPSMLASANVNTWREYFPRLATLEFSRDRKSMSVLCNVPKVVSSTENTKIKPRRPGNRLLVKGAPNLLIERCTQIKYRDGTVARITGQLRRQIERKVSELATRPLRCLALAVKESSNLEDSLRRFAPKDDREVARHPLLADSSNYRNIESGLTLVGIVGIKDPARPGVAESIDLCTKAGIRVMMITGDSKDTAIAIARDVHIFPAESKIDAPELKAYEGREFFLKSSEEQLEILKEDNIVFCRAEPSDKQKLIKMLQSLNEVTCMTGDGVNDAPALQQASIGVAMGITGTEVSKEAADMVLADDNFSTIVSAVEEGRRIYNNMQAFICFLISCNIGEICAIFLATLLGFPEPLTAMHLLWVNLVTDGPPATALGFNPPAPDLMDAPPRPSNEPIMTRWLLTRYCTTGLYVGLATIGVFAQHYVSRGISLSQLGSWSQCGVLWTPGNGAGSCSDLFQGSGRMLPQTLALTTLVCMEMLKALSAVSVDASIFRVGPQDNKWLLLGVTGPILLHLVVVYSSRLGFPGLAESFGMVPLSMANWVTVFRWAIPILFVDEVLKAVGRQIQRGERKTEKVK